MCALCVLSLSVLLFWHLHSHLRLLAAPPSLSSQELDANMKPKTRRKIEMLHEGGWKFDKEAWDASVARHNKWNMKEIFAQFDADGDGKLDIYEIARAFRAMGLPKRDGSKMDMDHAMFKSFDTNGERLCLSRHHRLSPCGSS